MMFRSEILGCGSYLPDRIVTNEELSKTVDTPPTNGSAREAVSPNGISRLMDRLPPTWRFAQASARLSTPVSAPLRLT
jgi:hypothetical protein